VGCRPSPEGQEVKKTEENSSLLSIDEADHILILNIERSTYPNWNGIEQRRPITITGDELKIVVPEPSAGGGRGETVWRRAK
jgi:hypothetical protein